MALDPKWLAEICKVMRANGVESLQDGDVTIRLNTAWHPKPRGKGKKKLPDMWVGDEKPPARRLTTLEDWGPPDDDDKREDVRVTAVANMAAAVGDSLAD